MDDWQEQYSDDPEVVIRWIKDAYMMGDGDWCECIRRVAKTRDAEITRLRATVESFAAVDEARRKEVDSLRAEFAECRRGAERYRTALEQIVAPFEDLNFVSGNKLLTYIHDVATAALAAKGEG